MCKYIVYTGIHVDSGQMYRVYRNQAGAHCPFISLFFFLSDFQILKCFVTLFSRTVRPRRLKLGTHVDSGQMYRVYRNQTAATYSYPYFFIFFLSNFQTLKFFAHFYQALWSLGGWNLVHTWTVGGYMVYTRIRQLLLIRPLIFSFSKIKILKFFAHFSQELWGLEGWNLVHIWTMGGCIVYTRIRWLLHICCFIFSFFFLSNFQTLKCFCHTFLRNCES